MNTIDYRDFDSIIHDLLSKKAWNVRIGHGSFLTMEFGKPIVTNQKNAIVHGEWHLWVYLCAWRIDKENLFLLGSEDNRQKIENVVSKLEGCALNKFTIINASLESELSFDNGMLLKLFPIISEDEDGTMQHWKLFMPNSKVLLAGPGSRLELVYEKERPSISE